MQAGLVFWSITNSIFGSSLKVKNHWLHGVAVKKIKNHRSTLQFVEKVRNFAAQRNKSAS